MDSSVFGKTSLSSKKVMYVKNDRNKLLFFMTKEKQIDFSNFGVNNLLFLR